ncbi:MAG: group II intron maturase-specific domain-containing protein [bacterium]
MACREKSSAKCNRIPGEHAQSDSQQRGKRRGQAIETKIPGLALLHQKGRNWDTGTRETDSKVQGRDKGNLIKKQWQEHSATDKELNRFIIGRVNYFNLADMINLAKAPDGWIRRRLRMCIWKQWWKVKTKHDNLTKLGIAT